MERNDLGRSWLEYDCPSSGIDFDVEPVPMFGSMISCSGCGGEHRADEKLGTVWLYIADPSAIGGLRLQDITDDWAKTKNPAG